MKHMNLFLAAVLGLSAAAGTAAENKTFGEARIYVNPGHGGWGANDRNLVTINHALGDTTGFYETNTNLIKGLELYHDLVNNGAGKVMLSRTKNGINEDGVKDGVPQLVGLATISADVEANNIDYFISIHSNAATEGAATNYPLVLYRGTDAAVGNGLVDAKDMGLKAWPYINDNGITFKSHYTTADKTNVRGDITFMGGSSTSQGYTGYYGVLRHGADGYLVEGCFHTYHPERHRLLNDDYCRMEGMRYARAIRSWFKGPQEKTGDIMGTVKNAGHPLENALYKYKAASMDAYAPLNGVTVVLKNAAGATVAEYTTDNEYNGIYVFDDLAPGKYTLDFTGLTDFHPYTEEIEVVANKTVFTNVKLTSVNEEIPDPDTPQPEVGYYTHPEQDNDIAAGSAYEFTPGAEAVTAAALDGLKVRRAILRDGKYYVLAHDAERNPRLMVINPKDGSLIKEMSLEGLQTEGFGGKKMSWTLSDIAFTNDGVLIGANSVVIGRDGNAYCNGDFYMYAWKADGTTPLEEQKPTVVLKLATNSTDNILNAGNNYSNLMANSIAVNGDFNNFSFYFDSHAGSTWTTTYGLRYVCWQVTNGVIASSQWNDANAAYDESMFGEDAMLTLSPIALNRIIADGSKITPKEFEISLLETAAADCPAFSDKEIATAASGANYFRYADAIFMAAPTYKADGNSYGVNLYDVTGGLDKAKKLAAIDNLITADGLQPMNAFGVVRNAEIDLYLMVGGKIAKATTEGKTQPSAAGRIMAANLRQEKTDGNTYKLSFDVNIEPTEAYVSVINSTTGKEVLKVPATADGLTLTATVSKSDLAENTSYNWAAVVSADNVTRFARISSDKKYGSPYGVAIDNNPESDHFGNIYVSNTLTADGSETGIYQMGFDGTLLNAGNIGGGITWTGVKGDGPRRLAVAADGRVFAADCSTAHAGVYVFDPATMKGEPLFKGSTNNGGSLTTGGTYVGGTTFAVGVRGEGDKTQLFVVDGSATGTSGWKKFINRYDIGTADVWTKAPVTSKAYDSYVGNANSSIVPVSTGFWAAQYRGAGSSNSGTPCLFYYSDKHDNTVFESSKIDALASDNGALAVDEKSGILAHSYAAGARVFRYKLDKEGFPEMTELFQVPMIADAVPNSFAFDYAGNLYVVSTDGSYSVYAMPTDNNSVSVPAKKNLVIQFGEDSVEEMAETAVSVYPNPASDVATVTSSKPLESISVYNVANGAEAIRIAGNGQTEMSIDVTGLAQGVYVVRVNGTHTTKLIKR